MVQWTHHYRKNLWYRAFVAGLVSALLLGQVGEGLAQSAPLLTGSTISATSQPFAPAQLIGLKLNLQNPLEMNFLMDRGELALSEDTKNQEYNKLIKYFLSALTIPDDHLWVNLSPNEPNRIIEKDLEKTQMGLDLLAQDYLLKQVTASLLSPEGEAGREFWEKIYAQAGNADIPLETLNRVWIVPDEAIVIEKDNTAWVVYTHLKVMLEEDYLNSDTRYVVSGTKKKERSTYH